MTHELIYSENQKDAYIQRMVTVIDAMSFSQNKC